MAHPVGRAAVVPVPRRLPLSLVTVRVGQLLADMVVLLPFPVLMTVLVVMPAFGMTEFEQLVWVAVVFGAFLVTLLVFFVVVPVRLRGQTVAMRWAGLRVVDVGGGTPTWRQHLLRSVGLFFDMSGNGLVGLLTAVLTPRRQRLGDLMAGTTVVWDDGARSAR